MLSESGLGVTARRLLRRMRALAVRQARDTWWTESRWALDRGFPRAGRQLASPETVFHQYRLFQEMCLYSQNESIRIKLPQHA